MRMTDKHGNSVEVIRLNGEQVFVARGPQGYVLHSTRWGVEDPRTPADLAALGVDLASLRDNVPAAA